MRWWQYYFSTCILVLLAAACGDVPNENENIDVATNETTKDKAPENPPLVVKPKPPTPLPPVVAPIFIHENAIVGFASDFDSGPFGIGGGGGGSHDQCPDDLNKRKPGICGCGISDADSDSDGLVDCLDNCPSVQNIDQVDVDLDDVGDLCDNCVYTVNADQANSDADALGDVCDSCPFDTNADQQDVDGDSVGTVCDCDDNNINVGGIPMGSTAFYVDPTTGNDGNSCLTPSLACVSIAGAIAKASDGDAIILSAGTFNEGNISVADDLLILGKGARVSIVDAGVLPTPRRVFNVESSATVTICGITITDGALETTGGGIFNIGTLTLSAVNITQNFVQGARGTVGEPGTPNLGGVGGQGMTGGPGGDGLGGGIFNAGSITAIVNSTIRSNTSIGGTGGTGGSGGLGQTQGAGGAGGFGGDGLGGGIFNNPGSTILSIVNSTISDNSARQSLGGPGGVGLPPGSPGPQGSSAGGGIFNAQGSVIVVANSTISANEITGMGAVGAGVFNAGSFLINHTIIGDQAAGGDCNGVILTTAPNLDSDGSCGSATTSGTINLGPLQNNGGPTDTHELLMGSSAINSGDATCGVTRDQRGAPRPPLGGGANCDIGSFEVQPPLNQ